MSEPSKIGGNGGINTVRIKTPQEIERQGARAHLTNYDAYRIGRDDINENLSRSKAITTATNNARRRAGYEDTGVRTRSLDKIFRDTKTGKYFTVRGDRIVSYRGNKLRRYR